MQKVEDFVIRQEEYADQLRAGRFNPALEIIFRHQGRLCRHTLHAGQNDDLHVFQDGALVYVLSLNEPLGSVGIQVFIGREALGDMFLSEQEASRVVGSLNLPPEEIAMSFRNLAYQN